MPHEFSYDADTGVLTARVSGIVDKSLVKQIADDMHAETVKHKCTRFLNDYRTAYIDLSTLDVFGLPKLIESMGTDPTSRHAIVVKGMSPILRFFETVTRNRGENVRIFTGMDQARAWLVS